MHFEMEKPATFSAEDCKFFLKNGYVILKNVFDSTLAASCREIVWSEMCEKHGVVRSDRTTWPLKLPMGMIYKSEDGYPWSEVLTDRLQTAAFQLCCGQGAEPVVDHDCGNSILPFGCGWWTVTFPGHHEAMDEASKDEGDNTDPATSKPNNWHVNGTWHIDGYYFQHHLFNRELGLTAVMLFSDVIDYYGGTTVAVGSHLEAARLIAEAGKKGLTSVELANALLECNNNGSRQPFPIVELTGNAGDVVFIHPMLLHARSSNLAPATEDGVRFLCHPSIKLKKELNFWRPWSELSILERSVLLGIVPREVVDDGDMVEALACYLCGVGFEAASCSKSKAELEKVLEIALERARSMPPALCYEANREAKELALMLKEDSQDRGILLDVIGISGFGDSKKRYRIS